MFPTGGQADLSEIAELLRAQKLGPLEHACARLLDEVVQGRHDLEPLVHPLGFLYVPLARWRDATLRLHLWPPVAQRRRLTAKEVSPMHDHTWDLFSYVACGALENVEIKVAEVTDVASAMSPVFRIFNIRGDGAIDRVTPTETLVTVEKERKERYGARSIYKMPADVVHRTEASSAPTVTLVLARRTGREFERALGPVDLPGYTTRREAFSCDSFTAGLRDALTQQA